MAHYSASFSVALRVRLENRPGTFADLARAIGDAGGLLDAIDLVRTETNSKVRDVSVLATNADHADEIVRACRAVDGSRSNTSPTGRSCSTSAARSIWNRMRR